MQSLVVVMFFVVRQKAIFTVNADLSVYTTDCWKRKMHFHTMLFLNMMIVTSKPNLSPKGNSQTITLQVKGRNRNVKSKSLHPAQADRIPAMYRKRVWCSDCGKVTAYCSRPLTRDFCRAMDLHGKLV